LEGDVPEGVVSGVGHQECQVEGPLHARLHLGGPDVEADPRRYDPDLHSFGIGDRLAPRGPPLGPAHKLPALVGEMNGGYRSRAPGGDGWEPEPVHPLHLEGDVQKVHLTGVSYRPDDLRRLTRIGGDFCGIDGKLEPRLQELQGQGLGPMESESGRIDGLRPDHVLEARLEGRVPGDGPCFAGSQDRDSADLPQVVEDPDLGERVIADVLDPDGDGDPLSSRYLIRFLMDLDL